MARVAVLSHPLTDPIAAFHGLPLIQSASEGDFDFILEFSEGRLQLQDPLLKNPLFVDFLSGKMQHWRKSGIGRQQPLGKAIGVKTISVLDLTAGLGVDAFYLACLGLQVHALERSAIVYELLQDGLRRLRLADDAELLKIAARLTFAHADAISYLQTGGSHEVIYFDPMYPEAKKSALPKKGMQVFRRLIGADLDVDAVLETALQKASRRVVLKRPLTAPTLLKPTQVFVSKLVRFDMYHKNSRSV